VFDVVKRIDELARAGQTGEANASRSGRRRVGKLVNVRVEAGKLVGDLAYNPKTDIGRQLRWWSENMPDAIGLSHNAIGQGETVDDVFVVEKIVSVRSVDLVADPATTSGLFQ